MKNFVIIGAAGYIAPRHMKAIRDTGNRLVAAFDIHDSVGILDSYFPEADFFTEFERFDRHCEKLRRQGTKIDYVVVCSPNYLHDAHVRFGLRIDADVICEKPLVLNPWNAAALQEMEAETGRKVYVMHQLRYHPAVVALKEQIDSMPGSHRFTVSLKYVTARGHWYRHSWKGNPDKSGGLLSNIGIHFFDLFNWLFGASQDLTIQQWHPEHTSGRMVTNRADIDWELSIDANDLPASTREEGKKVYRQLLVDNQAADFSEHTTDLHTIAYQAIENGKGCRLAEAAASVDLVYRYKQLAATCK